LVWISSVFRQILNSLEGGLQEHFTSEQPFPQKAITELMKALAQTLGDFTKLEGLLQKFMDYEKGGTFATLQKTWRHVFADKDIAKNSPFFAGEQRGSHHDYVVD
jgi:hypothetical protein